MLALDTASDSFFDRLNPAFLKVQTKITTRHGQLIEEWLIHSANQQDHMEAFHIPASTAGTEVDAILINHDTRDVLLLEVKRKAGQNSTSLKSISDKLKTFPSIAAHFIPEGYSSTASCFYYYERGAKREHITASALDTFCGAPVVSQIDALTDVFIDTLNTQANG